MKKHKTTIISIVVINLILLSLLSWLVLNKEYNCYKYKYQDGFVVKKQYEIIIDYFNGITYEETVPAK